MEMPTVYDDDVLHVEGAFYPDDAMRSARVYSIVYPPIGFFPFAGTGNGDYHGFYWPIGRERLSPLVAYSSHGAYALIPEHGDLLAAGRCQIARDADRNLTHEFQTAFASANLTKPAIDYPDIVAVDDHKQLLTLDPNSPFRNCAVADQLIAKGELELAEVKYRMAIDLLPEYGAAHFGLGYLLRRARRQSEASVHLRRSLLCPLAFWGGCFWADHILPGEFRNDWARKALMWLQNTKEPDRSLQNDPFISRVNELTLDTGVAKSRDIEISIAMIEEYLGREQFLDAVYLWITVGDRAALETTSFRERYGLTPISFGKRLAELFRMAGIERRAILVEKMLSAIEKPNGLYL